MLCGSAVKAQFCFLNGSLIPFLITLAPGVALGCLNTFLEIVGHSHCITTSGCWNGEELPRSSSQSWWVTDDKDETQSGGSDLPQGLVANKWLETD